MMKSTPLYDLSQHNRPPVRREGDEIVVETAVVDAILRVLLERLLLGDSFARGFFLPLRGTIEDLAKLKLGVAASFSPFKKRHTGDPDSRELRSGPEIPLPAIAEMLRTVLRAAKAGDRIAQSHVVGLQPTIKSIAKALA